MIEKALPVYIYKHKGETCSNGGISERYNEILLLCEDGFVNVDMDNPPENVCKVVKRNLWGEDYFHVEPIAKPNGIGWMYGGSIVNTSDSRFRFDYPLKLHDRCESQELYDKLSR